MVQRTEYLDQLKKLVNHKLIKVITGVRRCGKSTLLEQFRQHLLKTGVKPEQIISINFEDLAFESLMDYRALYDYVKQSLNEDTMTYIFLDEIQNVNQYQKAVDSLFIQKNVDLYITGSNAHLLSGDLATLLSGRYVEISMLPLSFSEFVQEFQGEEKQVWNQYLRFGGFPYLTALDDETTKREYLSGIYHTVLLKDVATRNRISDINLLESILRFLADNIGSIVSSKKIADSLVSYGRKVTSITVENYLRGLGDAYVIYKVGRYDIKGKQHLKSLEKYYLVDTGLRQVLLGERSSDIGHVLENIVYLELIRRGYRVSIGKAGEYEIDFVAERGSERIYYQVAATVLDPNTFQRELRPLTLVDDYYPRYILTLDEVPLGEIGINQVNILDFLMQRV